MLGHLCLSPTPELVLQGAPQSPGCTPDLTCSHLPHRQHELSPSPDCKVHPVGDSTAAARQGHQVTQAAGGHARSTATAAPGPGGRQRRKTQSPRGQQGHEAEVLASAMLGAWPSGWRMGSQVSDVGGKPGAAPRVPPLSSGKRRSGTSPLPGEVAAWRKELPGARKPGISRNETDLCTCKLVTRLFQSAGEVCNLLLRCFIKN